METKIFQFPYLTNFPLVFASVCQYKIHPNQRSLQPFVLAYEAHLWPIPEGSVNQAEDLKMIIIMNKLTVEGLISTKKLSG